MQEWVDNDTILLGTKCNHLLLLTVSTCAFKIIPLGDRIRRNFSTANITWGRSGIHSIAYNFSRTHFATGGVDPADCVIFTSDYKHVHTMIVRCIFLINYDRREACLDIDNTKF